MTIKIIRRGTNCDKILFGVYLSTFTAENSKRRTFRVKILKNFRHNSKTILRKSRESLIWPQNGQDTHANYAKCVDVPVKFRSKSSNINLLAQKNITHLS